jgi:ABC-type phosphate/phosphonate transport system substrate-binding protein
MKKNPVNLIIPLASVLILSVLFPVHASAASKAAASVPAAASAVRPKYILGFRLGYGKEADGQLKSVGTEIFKAAAAEAGFDLELKWYLNDEEYLKATKDNSLDLTMLVSYELLADILGKYNYEPIARGSVFGMEKYPACFYVNKDSKFNSVADLKHATALTYDTATSYYQMHKLLGVNPSEYFNVLKVSPNAISSLYAVALGSDADVAFAYKVNLENLKLTNPGPVKKLREIACSDDFYVIPLLASKRFPKDSTAKLVGILYNAQQDAAFKTIRPLLIQTKTKFIPAKKTDYDGLLKLVATAKKNGWDKDYKAWIAMAQVKDKQKK